MMSYSKPLSFSGHSELKISISDTIVPIAEEWDSHCGANVYVQSDYLKVLENNGPLGYRYYYVFLHDQGQVIGLVYCQCKQIKLKEDFRVHTHSDATWDKLKVALTKTAFGFIKHNILICGNVLLTGEYGIRLAKEINIDKSELVAQVMSEVITYAKKEQGVRINSTLLKDFYKEGPLQELSFKHKDYTQFVVQPDMVVHLNESWSSYDDYLKDVKSKYRVKFKKIKKKGSDLVFKELDEEEAERYNDDMYRLYKATADRAVFSLFLLRDGYFGSLKKQMGSRMKLVGVFLQGELVAFFTYISNGAQGDAHFLGYDVQLNAKYQIYFNILLKLLETAISNQVSYLNLSRTALEIKSSVGAVPHDMYIHLKYHNSAINKILPNLLSKFVPENKWQPRNPFK